MASIFAKYSPVKRKIIQVCAFGYSNVYLGNFAKGKIYKGEWKNFCNPGMNCYSCPAASLACPIGAMQAVAGSKNFNISFYVIGFILAIGVLFGRAVCGFLCPFGLIQELIHKIPSPKLHLPKWCKYIKYIFLVLFVMMIPVVTTNGGAGTPAFCEYICPIGTLEAGIPLLATHPELRAVIGELFSLKAAILVATIVGCVLVERFFCKIMCPLGAIYGLLNKIALYGLKFEPATCVSCGKCAAVCPMDCDPTKNADSIECIRCGKCCGVCPTGAISRGWRVKDLKVPSNKPQETAQ